MNEAAVPIAVPIAAPATAARSGRAALQTLQAKAGEPVAARPGRAVVLLGSVLGLGLCALTVATATLAAHAGWLAWVMLTLLCVSSCAIVGLLVRSQADRAKLRGLSRSVTETARTDILTGVYNRRALGEQLARACAHSRRYGEPVSLMIIDIDGFTATNERFGHGAGDELLSALSDCMREVVRGDDIYGRWGGDEFLIILPAIDKVAVRIAAERLRAIATGLELPGIELAGGVQISIGTATGVHTTPEALTAVADHDLQQEKAAKRAARASLARA